MNEGKEDGGSAFAYFAASAVKKVISRLKSDNQLMGQQKRLRTRCSNKAQNMERIIPLISSGTEGPLGIKHLPRLWLKTLLSATRRLPDGYKDIRPGFDYVVLEGLGINPDSARDFIFKNLPSYLTFEKWICEQPGADFSQENISKINQLLMGRMKAPEARLQILKESGLPEDTQIKDGCSRRRGWARRAGPFENLS